MIGQCSTADLHLQFLLSYSFIACQKILDKTYQRHSSHTKLNLKPFLGYICQRNELYCYKDLSQKVHSTSISNGPKLEITKMLTNWNPENSMWRIHTVEYYIATKRDEVWVQVTQQQISQGVLKVKEEDRKKHVMPASTSRGFQSRQIQSAVWEN